MTSIIAPGQSPWRVLLLDRDPQDPKWLLAAVALSADVRPASLDRLGRYTDWAETTLWVRRQLGRPEVALTPVHDALCWRVDERRQPDEWKHLSRLLMPRPGDRQEVPAWQVPQDRPARPPPLVLHHRPGARLG